jgi:hypothetical protein
MLLCERRSTIELGQLQHIEVLPPQDRHGQQMRPPSVLREYIQKKTAGGGSSRILSNSSLSKRGATTLVATTAGAAVLTSVDADVDDDDDDDAHELSTPSWPPNEASSATTFKDFVDIKSSTNIIQRSY